MSNFTTGFSDTIIMAVWGKGFTDPQWNECQWRYDQCGAWMRFSDYGNRDSNYGWEIDHIIPISGGGGDNMSNLQPLHYKNNVAKGDGALRCAIGTFA